MLRPVSDAADDDAVHVLPVQLPFAPGRVVFGLTWPHISDELQFVSRLLQTGSEWTISKMTKSIVGIGQWVVTDHIVISFEDAKARGAVDKEQRASLAAMKKNVGVNWAQGLWPGSSSTRQQPEARD